MVFAQFKLIEKMDGSLKYSSTGMPFKITDRKIFSVIGSEGIAGSTKDGILIDSKCPGSNLFLERKIRMDYDISDRRINIYFDPDVSENLELSVFKQFGLEHRGIIGKGVGGKTSDGEGCYFFQDNPKGGGLRISAGDIGSASVGQQLLCLDIVDSEEPESGELRRDKKRYGFTIELQAIGESPSLDLENHRI